jgi:competence protein ComEA
MSTLSRKETVGAVALLTIVVTLTGVTFVRTLGSSSTPGIILREPAVPAPAPSNTAPTPLTGGVPAPNPIAANDIVVHVTGAVQKPGVYHLPISARGEDALKAAGGPTADANTDALNLAAHLEDGTQLHFPTRKEQPEIYAQSAVPSSPPSVVKTNPAATIARSGRKPKTGDGAGRTGSRSAKSDKLTDPSQGQVNVNTANAETLQRLPGIGPSMAERILEYRKTSGGFQAPEDLMNVSGIGEKKFAKMRVFVRVR